MFSQDCLNAVYINSKGIPDVDISKISNCERKSMDDCEANCGRYYTCNIIATAEEILVQANLG